MRPWRAFSQGSVAGPPYAPRVSRHRGQAGRSACAGRWQPTAGGRRADHGLLRSRCTAACHRLMCLSERMLCVCTFACPFPGTRNPTHAHVLARAFFSSTAWQGPHLKRGFASCVGHRCSPSQGQRGSARGLQEPSQELGCSARGPNAKPAGARGEGRARVAESVQGRVGPTTRASVGPLGRCCPRP